MEQTYSVQQIKFELLTYLREFGSNGPDWTIQLATGTDDDAVQALEEGGAERTIWICKPTLSPKAAGIIRDHMVSRFGMKSPDAAQPMETPGPEHKWILMYREATPDAFA
ncbi:MAG: hypothetical protein RDA78_28420 [Roseibium sp.]|uniref:hypothetical protein n=1 Tax=Roseibium sp. TaxID=1936156 RepID=UPI003D9C0BEF